MKKKHTSQKDCNEEQESIKLSFPLNALIVERLVTLLQNALIRTQAMKMMDQPKPTKDKTGDQNKEKFFKKKNNIYSKEENESSSDEDREDSDNEEFLFIGVDQPIRQRKKEIVEEEMEAEIDYEGELISALDDLQFEKEKNINLQNEVDQLKERIDNSDMTNRKVL